MMQENRLDILVRDNAIRTTTHRECYWQNSTQIRWQGLTQIREDHIGCVVTEYTCAMILPYSSTRAHRIDFIMHSAQPDAIYAPTDHYCGYGICHQHMNSKFPERSKAFSLFNLADKRLNWVRGCNFVGEVTCGSAK
jgi:hypothetical protein